MRFQYSDTDSAFRAEVSSFLQEALPNGWEGPLGDALASDDDVWNRALGFARKLVARGWLAPHWPKEYGGAGLSIMQQVVYAEEMANFGAPYVGGVGIGMVGPILILNGTPRQKAEFLPEITSLSKIWCQGFSEPGAGSDLASLTTRAVRDGDNFVINGQKIWTTWGHRAQHMVMLARTDPEAPKHRGITMLLLDMDWPGITVRPLVNMAGLHTFNEVFFEDVRVPVDRVVGEINRGWYVAAQLLDFERSGVSTAAGVRRQLMSTLEHMRGTTKSVPGFQLKPTYGVQLAELFIEAEVGRMLCYRIASMQARGLVPNHEASIGKMYNSELSQRVRNFSVNALAMLGQVHASQSQWDSFAGDYGLEYMESVPATIAAGSSEVQRNIIATRGLGLPRS